MLDVFQGVSTSVLGVEKAAGALARSATALLGGWLADAHDYRFAFRITACTHALAAALLLPLVVREGRAARA